MFERLLNKDKKPTETEMILYCNTQKDLFVKINNIMISEYEITKKINFPYGNNYGWGIQYYQKKKLICNIFPENNSFCVMIKLSKNQFERLDNISEYTKMYIDNKYPCGDGGWIHYRVSDAKHYEDLEKIIRIKCEKISIKKDFNAMLNNNKDMPKILDITDKKTIERYKGSKMLIAPPLEYDTIMKEVPYGKLITVEIIRKRLAKVHSADFTCPLTAGIFVNICAWASHQRTENITPYWRVLKTNGELNDKYPEAYNYQIKKLIEEGHEIIEKGTKTKKFYVKNFIDKLV